MTTTSNKPETTNPPQKKLLLKAAFTEMVAVNFQIAPKILADRVPRGLELDFFHDETYVTLVCMVMRKVGLMGIPLTRGFVEMSLRFYVRRPNNPTHHNGTCTLKTYVSSSTGAFILGSKFDMPFPKLKMKYKNSGFQRSGDAVPEVEYRWKVEDHWNMLRIRARSRIKNTGPDTKVGFILDHTNHYQSHNGKTLEYYVRHPKWSAWDAAQANFTCDVKQLFGKEFVKPLAKRPASVFVSRGGDVRVYRPTTL
jgi:uncharacterized protein YqjF (DUF2071 family)